MWKVLVCIFVCFTLARAKVLPDIISSTVCQKSEPDYEACSLRNFQKNLPNLLKGVPELGIPQLEPLRIPYMTVNRTLNSLISINAVLKNVVSSGASKFKIESFKANPKALSSEVRLIIPKTHLEMEHDVTGQLFAIPLRTKGHFSGNFSNTQMYIRGNMKTVDRNGVKYFMVDKLFMKIRVGNGQVRLTSANPGLQFAADLISNFFNENPRRVMDAINPIFVDTTVQMYRNILDQILAKAPAKEWLPA